MSSVISAESANGKILAISIAIERLAERSDIPRSVFSELAADVDQLRDNLSNVVPFRPRSDTLRKSYPGTDEDTETADAFDCDPRSGHDFLQILDPNAKIFTFQTYDDDRERKHNRNGEDPLGKIINGELLYCWGDLAKLNAQGAGVSVTVNETNGKGRRLHNIVRSRAVWSEDDDAFPVDKLPLPPSITVETSPDHFHHYWLLKDDLSPEEHKAVQERLAESYGSDKSAKEFNKALRLPGFLNMKPGREPFMVRMVRGARMAYSREEILRAFPPVPRPEPKKRQGGDFPQETTAETMARVEAALAYISPDDRGDWVTVGMALKQAFGEAGRAIWDRWSAQSKTYNEGPEGQRKWESFKGGNGKPVDIGTIFHIAKGRGYRPDQKVPPKFPKRNIKDRGNANGGGDPQNETEIEEDAPAFSDTAIAERLIAAHRHDLRYVAELGQWLVWNGSCWKPDRKGYAFSRARKFCLEAAAEVMEEAKAAAKAAAEAGSNDPKIPAGVKKFARELVSAKTRAAIVRLAQGDARLLVTPEELDRDIWLLNTPDGVIDLRTGKMREHRASDLMTKMTSVSPDANCPTPIWDDFLDRIMRQDETKIGYLQRTAGYFCTGDIGKESLWFYYGDGGNGKGVYTTTLGRILNDYHCTAPIEILLETIHERHPADLARLKGARLVTFDETDEDKHWSEAKIKVMTGGGSINCRHMRQNPFEYLPQFKPLVSGNHKPVLRSVNQAIKRRFKLVHFDVIIPEAEQDEELKKDKLRPEYPGILAWMIQGCLDMLKDGLMQPEAVTEATADYLNNEDILATWLDERCDLNLCAFEAGEDLFEDWRHWIAKGGIQSNIASKTKLIQKLADREAWNLKRHSDGKRRGLLGLCFKPDVQAEREEDRKAREGAKTRAKSWYRPEEHK